MIELPMRCLAVAVLLLAALPGSAKGRWLRLATSSFELYSTSDEKTARDTILYFEQVRSFFLKAAPVRYPAEFPVRIIVFGNRDEFRRYSLNTVEIAYYAAGEKRDYIVMADASQESYAIAVHEYMHLVIRHSGLHVPVWLNEGLSDVYSSLRPVRDGVAVGDLIPGRMQSLLNGKWLTFESLTSASTHSPVYNEADRVGVFYAESWALTHMLFLSPAYRNNFGKFLMALNKGQTSGQACETAYGRNSQEVFKDLQKYIGGKKFYGRIFETQLTRSETQPSLATLPDFDAALMLADLLVATGHLDRARTEYQQLEQQQPGRTEVTESLGYLALAGRDGHLARQYFEKAFAAGESDPQMCLRLAILERDTGEPPGKILPALERAIQSKPDYADAQIQLGLTHVKLRQFRAAIDVLMSIQNVTPEQATPVFSTLAYAWLETGDIENAGRNLATARKWAQSQDEISGVERLDAFIKARGDGPYAPHPGEKLIEVEGVLEFIDCAGSPHRLHLQHGQKKLSFLMPEVAAVEFTQPEGGMLQLACGPQKARKAVVTYTPAPVVEQDAAGIIRSLRFE